MEVRFVCPERLFALAQLTTQLNLMKFLKKRAPDSRVLRGRASDATILSRRREKPGLDSSAFKAASATRGLAKENSYAREEKSTLLVCSMVQSSIQEAGHVLKTGSHGGGCR